MPIHIATTESDIRRAWSVMQQLRPQYNEESFVAQVRRQQEKHNYTLVFAEHDGVVRAAAGFRVAELLAWGKALYIDDLVADAAVQGGGFANQLFDWIVAHAREQQCDQLHLDSGQNPARYRAHRFYMMKGMHISSHHFMLDLRRSR